MDWTKIAETVKSKASIITTSISTVAAIGGGVIYIETNYAHAADVKELVRGQQHLIQIQQVSQRQQLMFQLEYYDDRVRRLTAELDQTLALERAAKTANASTKEVARAAGRTALEIQNDLDDTKKRRDLTRQLLTQ